MMRDLASGSLITLSLRKIPFGFTLRLAFHFSKSKLVLILSIYSLSSSPPTIAILLISDCGRILRSYIDVSKACPLGPDLVVKCGSSHCLGCILRPNPRIILKRSPRSLNVYSLSVIIGSRFGLLTPRIVRDNFNNVISNLRWLAVPSTSSSRGPSAEGKPFAFVFIPKLFVSNG